MAASLLGCGATFFGAVLVSMDISFLLGVLGMVTAAAIALLGVVGYSFEGARRATGASLIVLAFIGVPVSLGGVLIGFVATLVAGYAFLTARDEPDFTGHIGCPSCGHMFPQGYRRCPFCAAPNPWFVPGR